MRGTCGGAVLAKRERYTSEQFREAMRRSGLKETTIIKVLGTLLAVRHEGRNLGGRPREDDSQRIAFMKVVMEAGVSRWKASDVATADLPEPLRTTVRRRIYDKTSPQK